MTKKKKMASTRGFPVLLSGFCVVSDFSGKKEKYLIMCVLWISLLFLPCIFTLEISVAVFAEHLTDDS